MSVKDLLGMLSDDKKVEKKAKGMGTPLAEYSEAGPFSCSLCWYLQSTEPRKEPLGLCNEPHMIQDPKTEKVTVEDKTFAVVSKFYGCCRFIDPVCTGDSKEKFRFEGDPEEEAEEHESELSEEALEDFEDEE